jgi:hypothetical protein
VATHLGVFNGIAGVRYFLVAGRPRDESATACVRWRRLSDAQATSGQVALASERRRERLIGQLLADGFALDAACAAREAELKARQGPDLLLLGELDLPGEALRVLRAIRAGEAGSLRVDPALRS